MKRFASTVARNPVLNFIWAVIVLGAAALIANNMGDSIMSIRYVLETAAISTIIWAQILVSGIVRLKDDGTSSRKVN